MVNPNLSVIMPMYNEKSILEDLKKVILKLDKIEKNYEIILVNDGSTNNCLEQARKFKSKKVKIVGYKKNQGKGSAIKYGFSFAKGDYVVFLDCGSDLDISQISNFKEIMKNENVDIVIGSKKHKESKVYYPLFRRFMSKIYQILNKILFNLNVKDTQVGLKLFKKQALNEIMPRIAIKRFAFDLELLVVANKLKFKIAEAPIILEYKFESTVNSKAVFWMLWDTVAIFYRDRILNYYQKVGF